MNMDSLIRIVCYTLMGMILYSLDAHVLTWKYWAIMTCTFIVSLL